MSRIYAVREDDGRRVLVEIGCDRCGTTIKPHPEIATSGRMKDGWDHGSGTEKFERGWCPRCWGYRQ